MARLRTKNQDWQYSVPSEVEAYKKGVEEAEKNASAHPDKPIVYTLKPISARDKLRFEEMISRCFDLNEVNEAVDNKRRELIANGMDAGKADSEAKRLVAPKLGPNALEVTNKAWEFIVSRGVKGWSELIDADTGAEIPFVVGNDGHVSEQSMDYILELGHLHELGAAILDGNSLSRRDSGN